MKMKVNLLIGGNALNGYLNIDPTANPNDESKVQANVHELDAFVFDNECQELVALDVLDYFPLNAKGSIIDHWLGKISHGGKIIIGGLDIREVSRAIAEKYINPVSDGNAVLYGAATHMWNIKKGLVTIDDIITVIRLSNRFDITSKKFVGYNYIVEAVRK